MTTCPDPRTCLSRSTGLHLMVVVVNAMVGLSSGGKTGGWWLEPWNLGWVIRYWNGPWE